MAHDMIETGSAQVWIDDGILYIRSTGVRSTPESVSRTLEVIKGLTDGVPHPVFFDARSWPGGDSPAWVAIVEGLDAHFSAVAMLVDEDRRPDVGRYPESIDRLVLPFRLFGNREAALAFLGHGG